jgi:Zn-dependent protease with chaperone function
VRRAVLLVLLAAVGAVLLWPRDLPATPPSVPASEVFTAAQIAKARDYRDGLYPLLIAQWLAPLAAVGAVALFARRRLGRLRRPFVAALITAAAGLTAQLPFAYAAHRRAADAGLDLESDTRWALSALLAIAVGSLVVAVGYVLLVAVARRLGPIAAGAAVALAAVVVVTAMPLFSSTHAVRNPQFRAAADALEARMGVHPSVVVSDNADTTNVENAEASGLGPTERVTLDQTLLRSANPAELRAVLGHELGHVQRRHVLRGLGWFALAAIPLVAGILWLVRMRWGMSLRDPATVPVVLALGVLVATLLTPAALLISRRIEAEADWAGLRATGDGPAMEALQKQLALANLSDPDPPPWAVWLLFDHPPVMDRIAVARAYPPS